MSKIEKGQILIGKALISEIKEPDRTTGGIIIPIDVTKPKTFMGKVVIIADPLPVARTKEPIIPGDMVLHPPHAFVSVTIDGIDYRLINQSDILFTWKDD
jgi:chaperonin GroES